MSVRAARAAWSRLSPQERAFVREPRLSGRAPAADWITRLSGVARYDRRVNAAISTLGKVGFGGLISGFLGLFAAAFINGPAPGLSLPIAALAAALLTTGVVVLLYRWSWQSVDVPDVLADTVLPMLKVLELELPHDSPVQLEVDLRGSELNDKFHDQYETGSRLSLPYRRNKIYRDPWLTMSATLVEGSLLQLAILDTLRVRTQTKRSRSGKRKTKTKRKVKRRIRARLSVRRGQGLTAVGGAGVQVREGGKRQHITAEQREVGTSALFSTDPEVLVQVVARCFAHAERAA